jgi:hypothetical protein
LLYFVDTNGAQREMSFAEFERVFSWKCASQITTKLLEAAGVKPGSIVY